MEINVNEMIEINGVKQFIAVRAKHAGNPLLLYVHGGPGDAALPLVLKYNGVLAEHYTLVVWEQRGAGKSYYPFTEAVTIDTFVEDLQLLIEYLLKRYQQKKLTLVGHSWGSVLGMKIALMVPHLLQCYVGCGQVIDMAEGSKRAWEYAMQVADPKTRKQLTAVDPSYQGTNWFNDLMLVTKTVVKYKGSYYGHQSYNPMIKDFIFSSSYRLKDLINRQKGSLQSIQALWPELMSVSFKDIHELQVKIVLIEGKHDHHVDSGLAVDFYNQLTSLKQLYLFEKSCHFPQWSDAEQFNQIMISLLP